MNHLPTMDFQGQAVSFREIIIQKSLLEKTMGYFVISTSAGFLNRQQKNGKGGKRNKEMKS